MLTVVAAARQLSYGCDKRLSGVSAGSSAGESELDEDGKERSGIGEAEHFVDGNEGCFDEAADFDVGEAEVLLKAVVGAGSVGPFVLSVGQCQFGACPVCRLSGRRQCPWVLRVLAYRDTVENNGPHGPRQLHMIQPDLGS